MTVKVLETIESHFSIISMQLHSPSMFDAKAKIYGVPYNQSRSIGFDEIFSNWSAPKSS